MTRRGLGALSSAVEHFLDMEGVRGSIPLAPTILSLFTIRYGARMVRFSTGSAAVRIFRAFVGAVC
jgi:hypothetical protein